MCVLFYTQRYAISPVSETRSTQKTCKLCKIHVNCLLALLKPAELDGNTDDTSLANKTPDALRQLGWLEHSSLCLHLPRVADRRRSSVAEQARNEHTDNSQNSGGLDWPRVCVCVCVLTTPAKWIQRDLQAQMLHASREAGKLTCTQSSPYLLLGVLSLSLSLFLQ